MSDEGEKMCPLCAEEMDLTDQQLKPCKCGYEICVWCWHHIMEMAEKDEAEGRCPACRTPYDKEKIVGTAAKCERLVAEINMEKKKSQKAKTRTAEGRKQLSSVRVIQRNLVYIVGLPLNLADEDLLLHKEYFGQYGKVLKVSMSRTSAGTIQQFANNTCSVYITYSKEEEAVRCIQSIHGFTLEGRPLRACFGTTKYCHAWLRNVPCTNPDCLYLHEVGSQEDSFTKDDVISAHSRVQQITGITNNLQRRSGNVLPPPVDDYCNNSSATAGKPVPKSTLNNLASSARVSLPASSAGKAGALPAAASWGTRASNCQSSAGSLVNLNGPAKQKPDAGCVPLAFSAAVAGTTQTSVQSSDLGKKIRLNDDSDLKELKNKPKQPDNVKQHGADLHTNLSESSHVPLVAHLTPKPSETVTLDDNKTRHSVDEQSNVVGPERDRSFATKKKDHKLWHEGDSISIDKQLSSQNYVVARPNGLSFDCLLVHRDQGIEGIEYCNDAKLQELALPVSKAVTSMDGANALRSEKQFSAVQNPPSVNEEDFDIQRLSDVMFTQTSLPSSSHSLSLLNHLRTRSEHCDAADALSHNGIPVVDKQDKEHFAAIACSPSVACNGPMDNEVCCTSGIDNCCVPPDGLHQNRMGTSDNGAVNNETNPGRDVIESSIISNILSLDLDPWDDSLTSPQDLIKLLGGNERRQGSFNLSSSWKAQNSNQSRFSFARREECRSNFLDVEPSFNNKAVNADLFGPGLVENREPYLDSLGTGFGISHRSAEQYDGYGSSQSVFSSNKLSVSRSQISAPPGFSSPSRLPPPGFSSYGRNDQNFDQPPGFSSYGRSHQTFDMKSGNHFLETSYSSNPYQASASTISSNVADIEFIDPAILAVGKGRPPSSLSNSSMDPRPTFSLQTSAFGSDSQLQFLMQRSHEPHQSLSYADIRDNHSHNDAQIFSSGHMEPTQNGSLSSFSQFALQPKCKSATSNGHWDIWPEVMSGNSLGMAELLQNDRLSFNKLYGSYEESEFQMPSSGDLYNRTFRM